MATDSPSFNQYEKEFPKGEVLFREGEVGKEMYVVVSGKVTISKKILNEEKILVTLPPGEFFGEMSILNNRRRSATATVAENCKLLVIDPKTFEDMVKSNGEIALRMIKKLAERLRATDDRLENVMLKDPKSRVAHFLMTLAQSSGAAADGGIEIEVSTEEIEKETGVGQDGIDATLAGLVKAKIACLTPTGLVIADLAKLRQFLEFLSMKEQFGDLAE